MASLAAPGPERVAPLHEGATRLSVPAGRVGAIAVTGVTSLQVSPLVSTLMPEGGGGVAIPENVGSPP